MKNFFQQKTNIKIFLFVLASFSLLMFPAQSRAADGWTEQSGSGIHNWVSIAPSSDGSRVVALSYQGYIYTSSDYGVTWIPRTNETGHLWYSVTSSANGQYLAAIAYGGNIWTSPDYGITWTVISNTANTANRSWYSIDSSSDGKYLVAVVKNGNIWTSADYGNTWTNVNNAGSRSWRSVTSSANGQNLAAVVRGGNVWTSSNYGANWTERVISGSASTYFFSISSSALGDKLVLTDHNLDGYIYVSSDYGANWTPKFNLIFSLSYYQWYSAYYSDDGTKIIASMYADKLYQSLDNGNTWTAINGAGIRNWQPAIYSGDGTKIYAADDNGYILSYGSILSTPVITSTSASANASSITLNGNANTQSTSHGFEYGLTTSYGQSSDSNDVFNLETFSSNISSVLTNTIYHYRVKATNDFGSNYSSDATFNILPFTQKATDTARTWQSVAASSNGQYLAAVVSGGYIYTSNDYGNTWVQKTSDATRNWTEITSSSNGQYLAAVVSGGYIYTSNDYGNTWVQKTSDATRAWKSITSSANGQYLAAVVTTGYIYTSDDHGDTWIVRKNDITRAWQAISSSALGDKLAAVLSSTGYVYTSADYGVTWAETNANGLVNGVTLNDVTMSADGTKLVAGDNYGYIYTSADNGANWLAQVSVGSRVWQSIAISTDGSKIVAVDNGGYIYNSLDGGVSWIEQTSASSGTWQSVAASTDGSIIAVVSNPGYIYIYRPDVSTVNTGAAAAITGNSATLAGTVLNTGGAAITTRGFQYGLGTDYGNATTKTGTFDIESYTANIDSLTCGQTYHYRAYATNNSGTGYGDDLTFATSECSTPSTPPVTDTPHSSAPVQLPYSIGTGKAEVTVPMNSSLNIGTINTDGINILGYINSQAVFNTTQITDTHTLTISSLDLANNVVTLTIASLPQTITLKKGETKTIDLNNDNKSDLELTFTDVYVNRAEITAHSLTSTIITPAAPVTPSTPVTPTTPATPSKTTKFVFTKDLKLNATSSDVKELQKLLNAKGYTVAKTGAGSKGKETTKFGPATKSALIKFQKANQITPASGLFGPLTRKVVNAMK